MKLLNILKRDLKEWPADNFVAYQSWGGRVFFINGLAAERAVVYRDDPNTRVALTLIGSIYDLQQQITELQEKIDAEYKEINK